MAIADDILAATVAALEGGEIDLPNAPGTLEVLAALSAGVASVMGGSGGLQFYAGSEAVSLANTSGGLGELTITHGLDKTNIVTGLLIADFPAALTCYLYGVTATYQNSFKVRYYSTTAQTRTINYLLAYND